MKKKLLKLLRTLKIFFVNPHLVICFAIAWIITNGWAYASLVLGTRFGIKWLTVVAGAYIAVLYSPLCAEGILTFIIAIGLMNLLFPKDEKTLRLIRVYFRRYKTRFLRSLRNRKKKKAASRRKKEAVRNK
ncbi:MAG: hypothetical protein PUB97_03130 [Ruminococcus sp.]|nr:hypothetical protein [Ruminococcus sp.]